MNKDINKIANELFNALESAEKPPMGFLTAIQLSNAWGLKKAATANKLKKGMKLGIVEKKNFSVYVESNVGEKRLLPIPHYRFIKK